VSGSLYNTQERLDLIQEILSSHFPLYFTIHTPLHSHRFKLENSSLAVRWFSMLLHYQQDSTYGLEALRKSSDEITEFQVLWRSLESLYRELSKHRPDAFSCPLPEAGLVSRRSLNQLHEDFERMMNGPRFFQEGSLEPLIALRAAEGLNKIIHELEASLEAGLATVNTLRFDFRFLEKATGLASVVKTPIARDEFQFFQADRPCGSICLRYGMTGKSFYETFLSGQGANSAQPLSSLSPGFIWHVKSAPAAHQRQRFARVLEWLEENGFHSGSELLANGWVKLAKETDCTPAPQSIAASDIRLEAAQDPETQKIFRQLFELEALNNVNTDQINELSARQKEAARSINAAPGSPR
jgi:hypothetical protein